MSGGTHLPRGAGGAGRVGGFDLVGGREIPIFPESIRSRGITLGGRGGSPSIPGSREIRAGGWAGDPPSTPGSREIDHTGEGREIAHVPRGAGD